MTKRSLLWLHMYWRPIYRRVNVKGCMCFGLIAFFSAAPTAAQEKSLPLTAAYIYYFTKFIDWPGLPEQKTICVASDKANFKAEFDRIAVKSNAAIAIRFNELGQFNQSQSFMQNVDASREAIAAESQTSRPFTGCHIVYLSAGFSLKDYPLPERAAILLVVDDVVDLPSAAIRLVLDDNKLNFEINRTNAKNQGLDISAKLLSLAIKVVD